MYYQIRKIRTSEIPQLSDFLYGAIFQKDQDRPISREIINEPEIQVYVKNFGQLKDDHCFIAEVDDKLVGAVWIRNIEGFGSIDGTTPEFAISVYPEYRGHGIGTELMKQMLDFLKAKGYPKASLSVQKENYAVHLYKRLGFEIIRETPEEYIMEYKF